MNRKLEVSHFKLRDVIDTLELRQLMGQTFHIESSEGRVYIVEG